MREYSPANAMAAAKNVGPAATFAVWALTLGFGMGLHGVDTSAPHCCPRDNSRGRPHFERALLTSFAAQSWLISDGADNEATGQSLERTAHEFQSVIELPAVHDATEEDGVSVRGERPSGCE
jgi:hypothetical protein